MSQDTIEKQSPEVLELARKYDLTEKLMPFLDRHLIFPVVDFISKRGIYSSKVTDQIKYDLFKDSYMTEYIESLWENLHPGEPIPESVAENKKKCKQLEEKYQKDIDILSSTFEKDEVQSKLVQDKVQNLRLLKEYGVTVETINSVYHLCQLNFSQGKYENAAVLLNQFILLSTDNSLNTSAIWGKFACDLLTTDLSASVDDQQSLRDIIDQRNFADPLTQLHNRTWIIHWSLYLLRNNSFNKEGLIDIFFSPSYISTIQASCPWIIRYIAAAVISVYTKNRNSANNQRRLKDLIRVIGQELYEYQDPITDFVRALYIDYDFAEAQSKLAEADAVLSNDFFLSNMKNIFLESARHLVSEVYCRIHQRIDVKQLSARLNLTPEQGEKWIANLIKDTKMDAKINESDGTVILNHPVTSVYQQVIEKTKGLTFKSNQILSQALSKQDSVVA